MSGAASFSRSALDASTTIGIRPWWNGGDGGGGIGGGGGGGNNGTDGWGAMDGGGDGEGTSDVHVCSSGGGGGSSSSSSGDGPAWAAESPSLQAQNGAQLAPLVWLSAMWGLYAVWLRRSPLLTKALTSGALALSGDMAAQFFEFRQQEGSERKGLFLKVPGA